MATDIVIKLLMVSVLLPAMVFAADENKTMVFGLNLEVSPKVSSSWIQKEMLFPNGTKEITICMNILLRFKLYNRVAFFTLNKRIAFIMEEMNTILMQKSRFYYGTTSVTPFAWSHVCVMFGTNPSVYRNAEPFPIVPASGTEEPFIDFSIPYNVSASVPDGLYPDKTVGGFCGYATIPNIFARRLTAEEVRKIAYNEEIPEGDLSAGEWKAYTNHHLFITTLQRNGSRIDYTPFAGVSNSTMAFEISEERTVNIYLPYDPHNYAVALGFYGYYESLALCQIMKGSIPKIDDPVFIELGAKAARKYMNSTFIFWVKGQNGTCPAMIFSPLVWQPYILIAKCVEKSVYIACTAPRNMSFELRSNGFPAPAENFYFEPENFFPRFLSLDGREITAQPSEIYGYELYLREYFEGTVLAVTPLLDSNPFGRKEWNFVKRNETISMVLTGCSQEEFTCYNGSCIEIQKRCDGKDDCGDQSDEVCQLVKPLPLSYRPNRPHLPETPLQLQVFIRKIAAVEVDHGIITLQLEIKSSWKDGRVTLVQLSDTSEDNIITEKIWSPDYWFTNAVFQDNKDYLDHTNVISNIIANKNGPGKASVLESQEGYEYQGDTDANFTRSEMIAASFDCTFSLELFPFDSHGCMFHLKLKQSGKQIAFFDPDMTYLQPDNFTLSVFTTLPVCHTSGHVHLSGEKSNTLIIHILLQRRYGSYVLTTFLPCVVLTLIGSFTQFFAYDNFSDRTQVTLACLIVIASLFGQVSMTVPESAQPKLIDVYFFFAMMRLFICFLHHTVLCLLQIYSKNREEMKKKKEEEEPIKDEKALLRKLARDKDYIPYPPTYILPGKTLPASSNAWQKLSDNKKTSPKKGKSIDEIFNIISIVFGYLVDVIGYSVFAYVIVTRDAAKRILYEQHC